MVEVNVAGYTQALYLIRGLFAKTKVTEKSEEVNAAPELLYVN